MINEQDPFSTVRARSTDYNVYYFTCPNNIEHLPLEIETHTQHYMNEMITITFENNKGFLGCIDEISYDLYKHRVSETHIRWIMRRNYKIKELICQDAKQNV